VFNKFKRIYSVIAIVVLNLIVMFLIIEAGSAFLMGIAGYLAPVKHGGQQQFKYDPRENLSYYKSQEWGLEYWKEQIPYLTVRQPYVEQRCKPRQGNLINVDDRGIRFTPDCTDNKSSEKSLTIFCFGGSTMFGIGAPDWGTIPAYIAEITNAKYEDVSIKVVNCGQGYWISSQSVIQLIEEIKRDNVPDIAVFYDGINDVGCGTVYLEANIPMASIGDTPYGQSYDPFNNLIRLGTYLNSVRVAQLGLQVIHGYMQPGSSQTPASAGPDVQKIAEDIHAKYVHNIDIVEALSKQHGFDYCFFWQPTMMVGPKPLSPEEEQIKQSIIQNYYYSTPLDQVKESAYRLMKEEAANRSDMYYIADVFENTRTTVYNDGGHLTPVGNKVVAEKIADIIAPYIQKRLTIANGH